MKILCTLIVLSCICIKCFSQLEYEIKVPKSYYGLELSQFITNSGYGPATSFNVKIIMDNHKRGVVIGPYLDNRTMKITGINIHPVWFFYREDLNNFTPYIFYNLLYRRSMLPEVLPNGQTGIEICKYSSIEHHIGFGAQMNINNDFYFRGETGIGIYMGSIMKPEEYNSQMYGSDGFGTFGNVSFGYNF